MTQALIGGSILAAALAALAAAVWVWWMAGRGRHRRNRRSGPLLTLPPITPLESSYGTEAVVQPGSSGPSLIRLPEQETGTTDTVQFAVADRADFAHCSAEGRRTPHFIHRDGTRTCCRCQTITAGDQT
ncbi:hypothetical protein [Streptomyces alfalfae]